MAPYNWQQKAWPNFTFSIDEFGSLLDSFLEQWGRMDGLLQGLDRTDQQQLTIDILTNEAMMTSEIEGELLNLHLVKSSIMRNLGLAPVFRTTDRRAEGISNLITATRRETASPLTIEELHHWHSLLMQGAIGITVGHWRKHEDPMQIISGPFGRPTIHFEAPPSRQVPGMMDDFLKWFNQATMPGEAPRRMAPVLSAIAHLYFESIHPFEDGNGRIGRAVAEKALMRCMSGVPLFSLSRAIMRHRAAYYLQLENAQSSMEITEWIRWFTGVVTEAQSDALSWTAFILQKARFYMEHGPALNERQHKAIERMMEEGPAGFKGGMNARKYMGITGASKATATRDLQDLQDSGIFRVSGTGRSTSYELVFSGG
jgi:Fic family protein